MISLAARKVGSFAGAGPRQQPGFGRLLHIWRPARQLQVCDSMPPVTTTWTLCHDLVPRHPAVAVMPQFSPCCSSSAQCCLHAVVSCRTQTSARSEADHLTVNTLQCTLAATLQATHHTLAPSYPYISVLMRSSIRSMSGRLGNRFPCASGDYQLLAELGLGVTATVYLALCKPLRRKVAVKLLDLEAIEQAGGLVSIQGSGF
jgi:hypothetical protein